MQKSITHSKEQPKRYITLTGTSDKVNVTIKESHARASNVLYCFLDFPSNSQGNCIWPLVGIKFSSTDLKKMDQYLCAIINGRNICRDCHDESIEENIRQILIANFFEIEKLQNAQIDALRAKLNSLEEIESLHTIFKENSDNLLKLMQAVPTGLQEEIIKEIIVKEKFNLTESSDATLSPNGESILTWSFDKNPRLWNVASGKLIYELSELPNRVWGARFNSSGTKIVITSAGRIANIWNMCTGRLQSTLTAPEDFTSRAFFSSDEKYIFAAFENMLGSWIVKFNSQTGELMSLNENINDLIITLESAPSSNSILMRTISGNVSLLNENQVICSLEETPKKFARNLPHAAVFSSDGQKICAFNGDSVRVWNARTGQLMQTFYDETSQSYIKLMSVNGNKIATASSDEIVRIWNMNELKLTNSIKHKSKINDLSFSADGNYIITANADKTACIWDVRSGELKQVIKHSAPVSHATFMNNDSNIMTISGDEIVNIYSLNNQMLIIENDNPHALEQISLIQCIRAYKKHNQILDLNASENIALKQIFETLDLDQKRTLEKLGTIKKEFFIDNSKDIASSSRSPKTGEFDPDDDLTDSAMACTIQ